MYVGVFYLIARGLNVAPAPLLSQVVIVPLSVSIAMLPLPLGALGAFDFAFSFLYENIGGSKYGLLIVLTYRAITVAALIVCLAAYLTRSSQADEALHESEKSGN